MIRKINKGELPGFSIKFARVIFLILFLLLSTGSVNSQQELKFTSNLTSESGLSLNVITKILQDKRGFLWFGTYNGLNRYDGYNFKVFTPEPGNPRSICGFLISALYEDRQGNIWIGTNTGLCRYDWRTEEFTTYKNDPTNPNSLSNNSVLSIFEDRSGSLWIGTLNGLNQLNRQSNDFSVRIKVSDEININSLNSVTSVVEDKRGNIWFGTWKGLTKLQRRDGKLITFKLPERINSNTLLYNQISQLLIDNEENLWIATNNDQGVYKYSLERNTFIHYFNNPADANSLSSNQANVLCLDRQGNIWIGTLNGLNKYDPQKGFIKYFHDPSLNNTLINNNISSIIEDQTGLFWIGTERGISRAYIPINDFKYTELYSKNPDGVLERGRIFSVCLDNEGNFWLGSTLGLFTLDKESENVIPLRRFKGKEILMSENNIRSICQDKSGTVWMGSVGSGLSSFNVNTGENKLFRYNDDDTESLSNNGVISLCIDRNQNVWAGTWWGLNKLDNQTGKFRRYTNFSNNLCWVIFSDSDGKIWVGTDGGGVNELNPEADTFNNYLNGKRVISIYESHDGILWFGTTEGLFSYSRKDQKFSEYKKENGLQSNVINSICEDNFGNLWFSSDNGLFKYDRNNEIFRNYDKRSGLTETEFSSNSAVKSRNGDLFFGGVIGLFHFSPGKIQDQYPDANVVLTDLKIYNQSVPISRDGKSILNESITVSKSIEIPFGSDVISIDFALLDYFDIHKNKFRYFLEGFDKEWNEIGLRNSATYTNLPPGEYAFKVRASNDIGFKSYKETSVNIIIIPAFYQTWIFRIIAMIILILGVFLLIKYRTGKIQKQNIILENRVIERTKDLDKTIHELNLEIATKNKFFSIIAHDLRSPFTAMLGFSKHLVDEIENISKDELKLIAESILKSTSLTFSLLENLLLWARIQTGRIEYTPEIINLDKLLHKTTELLKHNAENKGLEIIINNHNATNVYADPNMVETILRNLLSNAIKFSNEGGEISITTKDADKYVLISVKDNGIGMSEEKIIRMFEIGYNISSLGTRNEKGSGLGLILCKEFIEHNGGTINIKSKVGEYSEISFTLPKRQEQIKDMLVSADAK